MRKLFLTAAVCSFALFFACTKKNDTNNGGSGSGNYFPLTSGTYWKYKDSADGTITTTTVTDQKKTIGTRTYTMITALSGTQVDTVYAAVDGPNYYYYVAESVPGSGGPVSLLLNYLNDTASVGYNWQYAAGQASGSTITVKTTIVEKGLQLTVNGKSFTNVTHTRLDLSTSLFGSNLQLGAYDFFIAQGVGIIILRANVGAFGSSTVTSSSITDYHIQ